MKDMKVDASSTQIMTYNILCGLKDAGYSVTFLAVCNNLCNQESVIEDFSEIVNHIYCIPSALNLLSKKRGILSKYAVQYKYAFKSSWYKKQIMMLDLLDDYDYVITHLPAIESSFYASVVKNMMPGSKYIQFWSDPYARAGLSSGEKLPVKRYVMKALENRILKQADEVVYGTPMLMKTQANEYPRLAYKMRYCDVSYNIYTSETDNSSLFYDNRPLVGYVGGYNSIYRNIDPLYQTFVNHPDLGNLVLCGYSDLKRCEKSNIKIIARCSPQRALGIEEQLDVHVCLLNKTMSQIPGKIFYQTNCGKPILIILDGPDKHEIKEYLKSFDRFEFSENNEKEITDSLYSIIRKSNKASLTTPEQLSPKKFGMSIIGDN